MIRLLELFWLCLRVGLFTFGGGAVIVPLIQQNLVAEGFMTIEESIDMVAIAQMTPGPFAINAATFAGTKLAGLPGAVMATLGMILPSLVITMLIARFFFTFRQKVGVQAVLSGIRPVMPALIAGSVWVIAKRTLFLADGYMDLPSLLISLAVLVLLWRVKMSPALLFVLCGAAGAVFLR